MRPQTTSKPQHSATRAQEVAPGLSLDEITRVMEVAAAAFRRSVIEPLLPLMARRAKSESPTPARRANWAVLPQTAALRKELAKASQQWHAQGEQAEDFDAADGPVAGAIRQAAAAMGKTQKQIADELGVSPAVISRVLKHPEKSKMETVEKIGKTVGMTVRVGRARG